MFNQTSTKQQPALPESQPANPSNGQVQWQVHFDSACSRFAARHSLAEVARSAGIGEQMLRNKLNPGQPHQLTARDLAQLYSATGDDTLLDGLLFGCGLTAVAISQAHDAAPISHRVIDATAKVAGVGAQVVQLFDVNAGRVTKGHRDALVGSLMATVEHLVLIATEIEHKFQAVPSLSCALNVARTAAGV